MEPITLAISAMIASAGLNAYNADRAAKRQQAAAAEMRQRQMQARNRATDVATKKAAEFNAPEREKAQQQLTEEMTGELQAEAAKPAITAQGLQIGASPAAGGGDYAVAKAREQVRTTESLRALASLMARTGAPGEQRRREAIGFGDASGDIQRIQSGAGNMAEIDSIGAQAAGQPNLGLTLAAQALNAYGMHGMSTAGVGAARTNDMGMFAKASGADPTGWWLRNGVSGG